MSNSPYYYTDPSQNFLAKDPHKLDFLFHPKSVAVIGAKDDPGSVGATIMMNLINAKLKGKIFPINPKRAEVFAHKCYKSILDVPVEVDLAIIVVPAKFALKVMQDCKTAKVKSAIIISAGFKELGEAGLELENELIAIANEADISVIGPNCLGLMNPHANLNATFAKGMASPGNIAFISQSGAMCTAVLDWSLKEKIGFSSFISIGSMAGVNWGDLIDYLGSDVNTSSLLLYMESIGDARSFMRAAREVAFEKPIIIIKPGRSDAAAKAAASHTGALAGSDAVFEAAIERVGAIRVDSISELFSMAQLLAKQPLPTGPNLTIVTNAGGPSVLATDCAVTSGAKLTSLSETVQQQLDAFLPAAWSRANPIDILGDANEVRYKLATNLALEDEETDGVLIILSPQDVTNPTKIAEEIVSIPKTGKPLLASWMGGDSVAHGKTILNNADVATFSFPDEAARAFAKMWSYSDNLNSIYQSIDEGSSKISTLSIDLKNEAQRLIQSCIEEGRLLLNEFESKKLLELYGIPVVKTFTATTAAEAASFAEKLSFPVVVKLLSDKITHKSDVGGVLLNLNSSEEVTDAFKQIQDKVKTLYDASFFQGVTVQEMVKSKGLEVIIGSTTDSNFGPVIMFGSGGKFVEVYKDQALAIAPLTKALGFKLMRKTKIFEALQGVRDFPRVDLDLLLDILVRFSQLVTDNLAIDECDINPLICDGDNIIAVDARFALKKNHQKTALIRSYPYEYEYNIKLKNGLSAQLRPIKPSDLSLIRAFHGELSENSVYQRFFEFIALDKRVASERLTRICFTDYDREITLVAELEVDGHKEIIGVGKLQKRLEPHTADIKLIIVDKYHHLGLGSAILIKLIEVAKHEKVSKLEALVLNENETMINLCQKFNFKISDAGKGVKKLNLTL